MPGVNRRLLTPGWVLVHLVFLAVFAATLWLGWWQWQSAHEAGGSFRNLGYALQWPLFGGFALFLWFQVVRMTGPAAQEESRLVDADGEQSRAGAEDEPDGRGLRRASEVRRRPRRSPVPPRAAPVDADEDPELAAYNAYLADLNRTESGGADPSGTDSDR